MRTNGSPWPTQATPDPIAPSEPNPATGLDGRAPNEPNPQPANPAPNEPNLGLGIEGRCAERTQDASYVHLGSGSFTP
jgi:hypothetical protein